MNTKEIIELVLDYLPDIICDSTLFVQFKEKYLNVPDDSTLFGHISVYRSLFEKIINEHPELSSVLSASDTGKLLRIAYFKGDMIILDVFSYQNNYNIIVRKVSNGVEKTDSIECFGGMKIQRSIIETKDSSYCTDFSEKLKCYDENDNLIPHDDKATECFDDDGNLISLDYEDLLDEDFAERFKVPKPMARSFRYNFSNFKDKINRVCAMEKQASYDDCLDIELLEFTGPYRVEDFKNSYISYLKQKEFADLQEAGYDNPEDAFNYKYSNEELIDTIGRNLLAQVGSGDIVISNNITDVLHAVVTDFEPNIVYTKGIIIKKIENGFILYYGHIENESVILIPKVISADEAKELYTKGMNNENNSELQAFFGINRGL